MRRITVILGVLFLLAGATAVWADGNPSANGGGFYHLFGNNNFVTFGFTAVQHKDGRVSGELEWNNHTEGFTFHASLDCLSFNGAGTVAYMSGTVIYSNNPLFPAGDGIVFSVMNDNPDKISDISFEAPVSPNNCNNIKPIPYHPLEGGNINVRP